MKKECIISRIEASQDGSPYVYVTFSDPNDYKPGSIIHIDAAHYFLRCRQAGGPFLFVLNVGPTCGTLI